MLTAGARTRQGTWMPGIVEHLHLAAGAGEDRAALSDHPGKANAGQYAGVMPQREPVRKHDVTCSSRFELRSCHAIRGDQEQVSANWIRQPMVLLLSAGAEALDERFWIASHR